MRVHYSRHFLEVITEDTNKWTKADYSIRGFQTRDFKEAVAKAKLLALSYGVQVVVTNTEWDCLLLVDERGKVIQ